MDRQRLATIFARFAGLRILVVGDFFLDKYMIIDHTLAERSLETGREAHQVVQIRCSPGAAGTVTSNLRAMDVSVVALSVIGDDGDGYELSRALRASGVDISDLLVRPERFTPTYTKPMLREADGSEHELERLDIKNRSALDAGLEDEIITRLRQVVPSVQAVIIADQVQERNCGVITDRVREELSVLARRYPQIIFAADSRERIGLFRDIIIKPNEREATRAFYPQRTESLSGDELLECGRILRQRSGKAVFLTMGEKGILVFHEAGYTPVPAIPVSGPIDIVGAGDATMAGIVAALAADANLVEAAHIGTLAAAVTIKRIGTTGTASRQEMEQAALRNWGVPLNS
jgi:rfaE bifunctional protein kinase chain/domain